LETHHLATLPFNRREIWKGSLGPGSNGVPAAKGSWSQHLPISHPRPPPPAPRRPTPLLTFILICTQMDTGLWNFRNQNERKQ
jgi:hypothetical protein